MRGRLARLGIPESVLATPGRAARRFRRDAAAIVSMARVAFRRAANRLGGLPPRRDLPAWNAMFRRDVLPLLERERRLLEAFDSQLAIRLNERRLVGQIVFEYGTLLNAIQSWEGLSVLDVGTGGSRLPRWMAAHGAKVVCFEYPRAVERRSWRRRWLERRRSIHAGAERRRVSWVNGDMLRLPFADDSFDLVTSLSVIEHLDTNLVDRRYVPYPEQRRLAAITLDEMVRVARPGGAIYLTSECCDYSRTTSDEWRKFYYFVDGPELSGAWPCGDVLELFYDRLRRKGCTPVGPIAFSPDDLDGDLNRATFRGPYFSCFTVLARKAERAPDPAL